MKKAIDLTYYRRWIQNEYNVAHGIVPETIYSTIKSSNTKSKKIVLVDKKDLKKQLLKLELEMDIAAANMDYEKAAELRDLIIWLKKGKNVRG
jgi:excinuclease ABC subunit B